MRLIDAARVIRSKNAGPTTLTLDLLFNDAAGFRAACAADVLHAAHIGKLYGVPADSVEIFPYEPALAIKISMPRRLVAGDPGDRDVYGAQQHGPLLSLEF